MLRAGVSYLAYLVDLVAPSKGSEPRRLCLLDIMNNAIFILFFETKLSAALGVGISLSALKV